MNAAFLMSGDTVRLGEHNDAPTVTVQARSVSWDGKVAVIFDGIPVTMYFNHDDQFTLVTGDWHSSPVTHSYR